MLRLAQDGHGQVQMIGSPGVSRLVHSFRHIFRWRHPKVLVSDCGACEKVPVFEDEFVVIVPIVSGDSLLGCPWCRFGTATPAREASLPSRNSEPPASSSSASDSSSSSSSSEDEAAPRFKKSDLKPHDKDGYLNSRDSSDSSDGDNDFSKEGNAGANGRRKNLRKRKKIDLTHVSTPLFAELDLIFSDRNNRAKGMKSVAFSRLIKGNGSERERDVSFSRGISQAASQPALARNLEPKEKRDTCERDAQRSLDASSPPQTAGCYDWLINNATEYELPDVGDDANPVYVKNLCGTIEPAANSGVQEQEACRSEALQSTVLGYVCYLKKLGAGIILVDCESSLLLDRLWSHPVLRCVNGKATSRYTSTDLPVEVSITDGHEKQHSVVAVIHLSHYSSQNVVNKDGDVERDETPPHIAIRLDTQEFGFCSSLETLAKLNVINKTMFPLPFDLASSNSTGAGGESFKSSKEQEHTWKASMLTRVVFEMGVNGVNASLDNTECVKAIDIGKMQHEMLRSKPHLKALELNGNKDGMPRPNFKSMLTSNQLAAMNLKERLKQQRGITPSTSPASIQKQIHNIVGFDHPGATFQDSLQRGNSADFELVFLGTGSAEPSKFRGSSAILLQTEGKHSMLLDAGEGSIGQLRRKFGSAGVDEVLRSLQCVWLSHKHADHVLGMLSIIHAYPTEAPKLTIIGPSAVKRWISEAVSLWADMGYNFRPFQFLHCNAFSEGIFSRPAGNGALGNAEQDTQGFLKNLALLGLRSIYVDHCHEAYGLVIHGHSGWSIVYSGDTRPCHRLIQAGGGCSLLIHEATFEDNLSDHAIRKRHSTVLEAIDVGLQMRAQFVVLTHFSQRYPQAVTLDASRYKNVCTAFDGMVVRGCELESLGRTLPFLGSAFSYERPDTETLVAPCSVDPQSFRNDVDIAISQRTVETRVKKETAQFHFDSSGVSSKSTHASIQAVVGSRAANESFQLHPEKYQPVKGAEILNTGLKKMKGFTTSFECTGEKIPAHSNPPSRTISSLRKCPQHVRFAGSDSD